MFKLGDKKVKLFNFMCFCHINKKFNSFLSLPLPGPSGMVFNSNERIEKIKEYESFSNAETNYESNNKTKQVAAHSYQ